MKYNGLEVNLFVEVVYNLKTNKKVDYEFNKPFKTYAAVAKTLPVDHHAYVRVELANSKVKIPGFGILGYAEVTCTKKGYTASRFLAPEY